MQYHIGLYLMIQLPQWPDLVISKELESRFSPGKQWLYWCDVFISHHVLSVA